MTLRETLIQAAHEGGRVLMERYGRLRIVEHKGVNDLVTDADRAAEEAIVAVIRGRFADHDILAEEADHGRGGGQVRWIIDPLDGTTNFSRQFPWFAVSIGVERQGELILGAVFNPCSGEFFLAEKGQGAFLGDKPIRVSSIHSLSEAFLATGFPYDRKSSAANNYQNFIAFQQRAFACRRAGSAALDLAYTAAGRFDGYWELKLKPWDVAAGALLVAEAGGRLSDFAGGPLDIHGKEMLASNGLIHEAMVEVLKGGVRP